jgi:hypothetical protein
MTLTTTDPCLNYLGRSHARSDAERTLSGHRPD